MTSQNPTPVPPPPIMPTQPKPTDPKPRLVVRGAS